MHAAMAAVLLAMATAPADAARPLDGGDRVRITRAYGPRVVAMVAQLEPDALLVRTSRGAALTRVPLADLRRLEVARGRRGHFQEGAIIGFTIVFLSVAGTASGLACGFDTGRSCPNVGAALGLGIPYGVMAAGVFGLAGLTIRTDRWVEVPAGSPLRPRLGAALVPRPGGAAVRLSLSF